MNTVHKGVDMPKIIKDLKPHIKEEAMILFTEVGYEKVSMRALAKKVGIAVGTLYNYFPNKEDLYMDVLVDSWTITINSIEKITTEPVSLNLLKSIIGIIMDDMILRQGLGKDVLQSKLSIKDIQYSDLPIKEVFARLFEITMTVVEALGCKYAERYATTLIISTANMLENFPDEREANIEFLSRL
jgi:AcrR family transcriptional regulator